MVYFGPYISGTRKVSLFATASGLRNWRHCANITASVAFKGDSIVWNETPGVLSQRFPLLPPRLLGCLSRCKAERIDQITIEMR